MDFLNLIGRESAIALGSNSSSSMTPQDLAHLHADIAGVVERKYGRLAQEFLDWVCPIERAHSLTDEQSALPDGRSAYGNYLWNVTAGDQAIDERSHLWSPAG
jgi:hypothetical protein